MLAEMFMLPVDSLNVLIDVKIRADKAIQAIKKSIPRENAHVRTIVDCSSPTSSVKPTDKHFRLTGCYFFQFEGGKVVEEWDIYDRLTLMQQLGYRLVPPDQKDDN